MTTPLVPWFISDLFKAELYKVQECVVRSICDAYDMNITEVMARIKLDDFKFEDNDIRIIQRKHKKYGSKNKNAKCIARVYDKNERTLSQCTRSQRADCDCYCKSHFDLMKRNALVLGTINDDIPKHIIGKVTKKLY